MALFFRFSVLFILFTLTFLLSIGDEVYAKRVGGGSSVGRKSTYVQNREARDRKSSPSSAVDPKKNEEPSQKQSVDNRVNSASPNTPSVKNQPVSTGRRWLAPFLGIASAIGFAALLSYFGMSADFAAFLILLVVGALILFVVFWLVRRVRMSSARYAGTALKASLPVLDEKKNESSLDLFSEQGKKEVFVSQVADDQTAYLREFKLFFARLQQAWSERDLGYLNEHLTSDLLTSVSHELKSEGSSKVDVVWLDAECVATEVYDQLEVVEILFKAQLREYPDQNIRDIEEVWLFERMLGDNFSKWKLAGIQPLQG
jgi:predicted lipid-binding transport protein (Tim44 family)